MVVDFARDWEMIVMINLFSYVLLANISGDAWCILINFIKNYL